MLVLHTRQELWEDIASRGPPPPEDITLAAQIVRLWWVARVAERVGRCGVDDMAAGAGAQVAAAWACACSWGRWGGTRS